jgi:hypothetical protein
LVTNAAACTHITRRCLQGKQTGTAVQMMSVAATYGWCRLHISGYANIFRHILLSKTMLYQQPAQ